MRLADIANALTQGVVESQTTYMYLAAVLKQSGGVVDVNVESLEALRDSGHWEVTMQPSSEEGKVQFRLLEGAEQINAALGRTPGGLIVP